MRAMRTLGSLVVLGGSVVLAYGCSAAANAPVGDSPDAGNSNQDYGGGDNSSSDASTGGKKDSGGGGGGGGAYDAGPPKLPEGSPCDPSTAFTDPQATDICGLCGTTTRACFPTGDSGTSGTWGAWGTCSGEVTAADKCDPSATYTGTACGNCGTMPQVCGSDCHFETGFDCTEPAGACAPGDIKFVLGASCTTAGQGRQYTCSATCSYGSPSACEVPPPNPHSLTISSTVGTTVNAVFTLSASTTTDRVESGSCPSFIDTGSDSSYMDIGIVNPTTRTVSVSVWDGRSAAGGVALDTVMSWYASPVWPPADRTMCTGTVSDDCNADAVDCSNTTASGDNRWSSLSGTNTVSIPPNSTVTVTVAMYSGSDAPGAFKLFAKTEN